MDHIEGMAAAVQGKRSPRELVHPDDRATDAPALGAFLAGKTDRYLAEKRYVRKNGEAALGFNSLS